MILQESWKPKLKSKWKQKKMCRAPAQICLNHTVARRSQMCCNVQQERYNNNSTTKTPIRKKWKDMSQCAKRFQYYFLINSCMSAHTSGKITVAVHGVRVGSNLVFCVCLRIMKQHLPSSATVSVCTRKNITYKAIIMYSNN